jgi:hypothetical protein
MVALPAYTVSVDFEAMMCAVQGDRPCEGPTD